MARIIVIDDDEDILLLIKNILKKSHVVDTFSSLKMLNINLINKCDLMILDVMMDEEDGFSFMQSNRKNIDIPVIFLTAKIQEKDKIEGFASGADDYITKPFSIDELRARVDAHLRREKRQKHLRISDKDISIDLLSKEIYFKDYLINLTQSEFSICKLLLTNINQVFTKEDIYIDLYGYDGQGDSQTSITERIKQIRSKFKFYNINPIKTIWGIGYKWEIQALEKF